MSQILVIRSNLVSGNLQSDSALEKLLIKRSQVRVLAKSKYFSGQVWNPDSGSANKIILSFFYLFMPRQDKCTLAGYQTADKPQFYHFSDVELKFSYLNFWLNYFDMNRNFISESCFFCLSSRPACDKRHRVIREFAGFAFLLSIASILIQR